MTECRLCGQLLNALNNHYRYDNELLDTCDSCIEARLEDGGEEK